MPQEYIKDWMFLTASAFKILSPVMGQVPLFANVAAKTLLLSQVISKDAS